MIASLPMYTHPEIDDALHRYWALIRRELADVGFDPPTGLSQNAGLEETWRDPELVFGQTCGLPYRDGLYEHVGLIGTPNFGLEGCPAGWYRSAMVVRVDDPRTSVAEFGDALLAFNGMNSQSGFAAALEHSADAGIDFHRRLETGAHVQSIAAIVEGAADIAAIDAMTLRLLRAHDSIAERIRVVDWTRPTPGLPYITANPDDAPRMFEPVRQAIRSLDDADRALLGILDLVKIPTSEYLAIPPAIPPPAA